MGQAEWPQVNFSHASSSRPWPVCVGLDSSRSPGSPRSPRSPRHPFGCPVLAHTMLRTWCPARGPATHRHQELQRAHVVALGLLQLAEHAHAQSKLLIRVPGALVAHGGQRDAGLGASVLPRACCRHCRHCRPQSCRLYGVPAGTRSFTCWPETGAWTEDGAQAAARAGRAGLRAGQSLESGSLARPAAPASRGPSPRGGGSSHSGDLDINQMLSIHVTPTLYP